MTPLNEKGDRSIRKALKQAPSLLDGGVDEASRDKGRSRFRKMEWIERADERSVGVRARHQTHGAVGYRQGPGQSLKQARGLLRSPSPKQPDLDEAHAAHRGAKTCESHRPRKIRDVTDGRANHRGGRNSPDDRCNDVR
ncbi:MAG TPA: hypothetical protein VJM10_05170, partial [Candidatus Methylomirabilis sp.]|nr:hypothetical protein [Candidatus Methylomirabilis sp.]